ncbi:heavy metal-binding protein HIP-like isoform X1 [Thunnus maccoyii]|uniref:heavy metal-binding protein HIP-like isoform X1 n=1 Tax=Thunnus maccoyii TaxID=8240 RepID=UPI001C4B68B0|nr:heavy metal-binding protein HIP-like isoform X1 [Thunnus maccoyii]
MRSAAAFLALLLCLYWTRAQGESGGVTENDITQTEVQSEILDVKATSDQTNITPDIWAELEELRDMVIQHSVELRKMEKLEQENTAIQARLTASEIKNAVLEARLNTAENVVEELKRENTVLEARMNNCEKVVEELKRENSDLKTRLNTAENVVEELKRENTVLEARMSSNELQVEELKRENAEQPKVAFSVGLTDAGYVGPFNTEITLKFSKIFTNIGQAYSPTTGVFTAPVRGTYYFRFTGFETRSSNWMGIYLYHNDKRITISDDINDSHGYVSVSNGFVLQLEKGDVIYLVLPSGYLVYDSANNRTTFSGFLLFAM